LRSCGETILAFSHRVDGVTLWRCGVWAERIYDAMPIVLQNAAVSVKGWQFHSTRYLSRSFEETARWLEQNERLSSSEIRALQFEQFRIFAEHCYEKSPYYRKRWDAQYLHPRKIRCPRDIQLIPIVPKEDLRSQTETFYTQNIAWGMTPAHTSGTTGSPLTVHFSRDDVGKRHAFLERCRRWAGVRIGMRRATFTGRNIIPQSQKKPPFWRHNHAGNQLLFSSYHLSPKNLSAYIEALEKFQPEILDGYPSAVHIVAEQVLRSEKKGTIRPIAILVSGDCAGIPARRH